MLEAQIQVHRLIVGPILVPHEFIGTSQHRLDFVLRSRAFLGVSHLILFLSPLLMPHSPCQPPSYLPWSLPTILELFLFELDLGSARYDRGILICSNTDIIPVCAILDCFCASIILWSTPNISSTSIKLAFEFDPNLLCCAIVLEKKRKNGIKGR